MSETRRPTDLSKLPVWARTRIETAERNVEYWKMQAGIVGGNPEDAEAFWTLGLRHEGAALPNHATVYFRLGKQLAYVRVDGADLLVYGEYSIVVAPKASNMIHVRMVEP